MEGLTGRAFNWSWTNTQGALPLQFHLKMVGRSTPFWYGLQQLTYEPCRLRQKEKGTSSCRCVGEAFVEYDCMDCVRKLCNTVRKKNAEFRFYRFGPALWFLDITQEWRAYHKERLERVTIWGCAKKPETLDMSNFEMKYRFKKFEPRKKTIIGYFWLTRKL